MGTNFAVAPGEYLQEWIDGNGMSVGEFAVELGVTVAEISIMSGRAEKQVYRVSKMENICLS